MRIIYKYDPVMAGNLDQTTGLFWLELPEKHRFLHAEAQTRDNWLPMMWFEVDLETEKKIYQFCILGTGNRVPEYAGEDGSDRYMEHLATAVCSGGRLVWHLYESVSGGKV